MEQNKFSEWMITVDNDNGERLIMTVETMKQNMFNLWSIGSNYSLRKYKNTRQPSNNYDRICSVKDDLIKQQKSNRAILAERDCGCDFYKTSIREIWRESINLIHYHNTTYCNTKTCLQAGSGRAQR